MSVIVTKDKTAELLKAIVALTQSEVLVGIPADSSAREPEPGEKEAPSNALLGYVHEFGSPELNIPERPFLIPGVSSVRDKAAARMKKIAQEALNGDVSKVEQGLNIVGLMAQSAVQERITEGPFTPLADITLARRRARGRTGDKPLLDSGQLRRSITYTIRTKGK